MFHTHLSFCNSSTWSLSILLLDIMSDSAAVQQDVDKAGAAEVEQLDIEETRLAHIANHDEHELGIWKSLIRYPWASAWCVYAAWCIILLSFDVQASGSVVGIPRFRQDFGYEFEGGFVLQASWQSAFNGAPVAR
jgi:hypothetical protein